MILAGCSGTGDSSKPPPIGNIPVIRGSADVAKLTLPLDPYTDNLAFIDLIERATDALVQKCMRRFGLTYPAYLPADNPNRPEHLRRWGIADPDEARQYGYVPSHVLRMKEVPPPGPVSREADDVAAGRVTEYRGQAVPDRGCFGEAADILSGGRSPGVIGDVALPRRLANESYEYAVKDSRVTAAYKQWATCMRVAGFGYRSPMDASENPEWTDLDLRSRPTKKEIETATADAHCRVKVNLVGIMYAVESAYQQRALDKHRAEVEREGAQLRAMEQEARVILGVQPR